MRKTDGLRFAFAALAAMTVLPDSGCIVEHVPIRRELLPGTAALSMVATLSAMAGAVWVSLRNEGNHPVVLGRCIRMSYFQKRAGRRSFAGGDPPCPSPATSSDRLVLGPGETHQWLMTMGYYGHGSFSLDIDAEVYFFPSLAAAPGVLALVALGGPLLLLPRGMPFDERQPAPPPARALAPTPPPLDWKRAPAVEADDDAPVKN